MLWPDRLGKGKVAKSKLRLKRPATGQSQSAANRAAPKPRVRPSGPAEKGSKVPPASAGGTAGVGVMVEAGAPAAGGSLRAGAGPGAGTAAGGGNRVGAAAAAAPAAPAALAKTSIGTAAAAVIGVSASQLSAVTQPVAMVAPPSTSVSSSPAMEVDVTQGMAVASTMTAANAPVACAEASERLARVDLAGVSEVTAAPEAMVVDVIARTGTMSLASQLAGTSSAAALVGGVHARSVDPAASASARGNASTTTAKTGGDAISAEAGSATSFVAGAGEVGPSHEGEKPGDVQTHDGNGRAETTGAARTPTAVGGPAVGPSQPPPASWAPSDGTECRQRDG